MCTPECKARIERLEAVNADMLAALQSLVQRKGCVTQVFTHPLNTEKALAAIDKALAGKEG